MDLHEFVPMMKYYDENVEALPIIAIDFTSGDTACSRGYEDYGPLFTWRGTSQGCLIDNEVIPHACPS